MDRFGYRPIIKTVVLISNKPLARLGFRNCRVLQSTSKSWLKIHIGDKCGGKQAEVAADMGEEAGGERERERERGAMSFLQFYSKRVWTVNAHVIKWG
jgi:hypothetical protein